MQIAVYNSVISGEEYLCCTLWLPLSPSKLWEYLNSAWLLAVVISQSSGICIIIVLTCKTTTQQQPLQQLLESLCCTRIQQFPFRLIFQQS